MGLFNFFTKKGIEAASTAPNPILDIPKQKISGELPFVTPGSEAHETPRTLRFAQYKYGKLTQSSNGPILHGFEHTVTGYSVDMSSEMRIHPKDIFGSNNQDYDSDRYPGLWKQEGGEIVKKTMKINGELFIVCAQRAYLSEGGEQQQGRLYAEMHVLLIPVKEWSAAVIPQLGNMLNPKSLVEKRNQEMLDIELSTDILDRPLPPEWMDVYVKEMITHCVGGDRVVFQDKATSENEFLQKIFYCLICLPESVAHQISFGAGIYQSLKTPVRICQAARSWDESRRIADTWYDVDPQKEEFGQKYLEEVTRVIAGCKTPREVIRAISNISEEFRTQVERNLTSQEK